MIGRRGGFARADDREGLVMDIKIATFNVENLFNRYAFLDGPWSGTGYEKYVMAVDVASVASRQGDLVTAPTTTIQRNNTALAIEGIEPDILVVQEIENIYTLRNFNNEYLSDYFETIISLDGNDPRAIDVGILIKRDLTDRIRVVGLRTHIDDRIDPNKPVLRDSRPNFGFVVDNAIFSRDCLEIDLQIGKATITVLANHFKAQDGSPTGNAEQKQRWKKSGERRKRQAERVAELVDDARQAKKLPIVLGDLNIDSKQKNYDKSLDPLLDHNALADPLGESPQFKNQLWTHFYDSGKSVSRLDYILTDEKLEVTSVEVFRKGLSTKCKQYAGERFSTIGPSHTEASDHCPTAVTIKL
jgi:endonuclease/exonuclease/phosphatase family metal-dependent hydrolase